MTDSDDLTGRMASLSEERRALLLKRLRGKQKETEAVGIPGQSHVDPLPLSYTQQRVWFLQQLYPDTRAYNMAEAWRVKGSLDLAALQQALNEVVSQQASLRTSFIVAEDGHPLQKIAPEARLDVSVQDISPLPQKVRQLELQTLVLQEGNFAFDLSNGPLVRLSVIRLDDREHVLLLTFHHIITDEWSNDIFWRALKNAYAAVLAGEPSRLPELPIQYADYAVWQREQVRDGSLDSQQEYWQKQLGGQLPLLQLPADHPRPAGQSLRGGVLRRMLAPGLLQGLQSLSQEEGTTLFMTLLAAFQVLLYRYSGQEDILVGTPIANRQRPETKDVMGMFINTAVMRGDLSGNPSFRRFLGQVRQVALEGLANQDLPFDLLVQNMHPERDLSYNPLFQSMFVYRADDESRALPGLDFERIAIDRGVSKFDLTLFAGEEDGALFTALEFSSDLFEPPTAERLLDHWQALLVAIVGDPDAPVDTLSFLTPGEAGRLLEMGRGAALPLPDQRCLHEQIGEVALRNPDQTAVVGSDTTFTYAELNARSDKLAHCLIDRGVIPGTPVGLFIERSAEMLVGILGILKAGGAYVPLEPAYPGERIAFALQDTGASVVVTQSHLLERLPAGEALVITLDEDLNRASSAPATSPKTALTLDDPAYIIHTSGSTGTPKGVVVTHRNLLASTMARDAYYGSPVERFLLLSSFAFDSSVAGIFWTLAGGGTLVLPEPDGEKDVHKLASIIAREAVTHTLALPALYRLLLSYAPHGSLDSMQVVIVAGEACPPDLGQVHYRHLPHASLYNEYGPTEATVWCTVHHLSSINNQAPVPIGRPIPGSRIYILDSRRQPVPVGLPGELYVGGAGVTPGYLNNPQLTAKRFLELDLAEYQVRDRVYRTGDLAFWQPDGEIGFLGRVDNQVKIRGFRIEPGEIETILQAHPAVHEAAVTLWQNLAGESSAEKSLIAYVVSGGRESDGLINESKLQAFLGDQLPNYMVPRQIIFLQSLPRHPNGKLDRSRLPSPQLDRSSDSALVPPQTEQEKTLARIWSEVLGLSEVGIEDNFFALGGDSISSIRVVASARQQGINITPRQFLQEQTIARILSVSAAAKTPAEEDQDVRENPLLLPVNEEGDRPPFFYAHGVFGDIASLTNVIPLLDADQPIYGLQAIGLNPDLAPDRSIEQMAARYVEAIRQVQPKGPYYLGGFCFGGVLAYEIARQFEQIGEHTALLAIIEGSAPRQFHRQASLFNPQRMRIAWFTTTYWAGGYEAYGGRRLGARIQSRLNNDPAPGSAYYNGRDDQNVEFDNMADYDANRPEIHFKLREINREAVDAYIPQPINGRVTLIRARHLRLGHALFGEIDPERGWGSLARSGVSIRFVDGTHEGILKPPHAAQLARELQEVLIEANNQNP